MIEQRRAVVITLIIIFGLTALVIFWPKITKRKPPEPIKRIREEVKGTKIGNDLLNVLGESSQNENNETPIDNLLEKTSNVIKNTTNIASEKVREEITKVLIEKSSDKIIEQLNKLPEKEKEEIKKEFCQ